MMLSTYMNDTLCHVHYINQQTNISIPVIRDEIVSNFVFSEATAPSHATSAVLPYYNKSGANNGNKNDFVILGVSPLDQNDYFVLVVYHLSALLSLSSPPLLFSILFVVITFGSVALVMCCFFPYTVLGQITGTHYAHRDNIQNSFGKNLNNYDGTKKRHAYNQKAKPTV
uniref:Uncharacterized protein n=1 Tax=Lygus hesperus TaxID=30085 RepID=A0A146LMU0_LYGHE